MGPSCDLTAEATRLFPATSIAQTICDLAGKRGHLPAALAPPRTSYMLTMPSANFCKGGGAHAECISGPSRGSSGPGEAGGDGLAHTGSGETDEGGVRLEACERCGRLELERGRDLRRVEVEEREGGVVVAKGGNRELGGGGRGEEATAGGAGQLGADL